MTVPDPHESSRAPLTRRALREARERATREVAARAEVDPADADMGVATVPIPVVTTPASSAPADAVQDHPPIFKPPPPPVRALRTRPIAVAAAPLLNGSHTVPRMRHARRTAALPARAVLAAASVLILAGGTAGTAMALSDRGPDPLRPPAATADIIASQVDGTRADAATPTPATSLPPVTTEQSAPLVEVASLDVCDIPAFTTALAAHDDAAAIRAAGGADEFRTAVAEGRAPCVSLSDPAHAWVVVDKLRPFDPIDYTPSPLTVPDKVRSIVGGELRADAAAALTRMVAAARADGAGEIALQSGYRSYKTQKQSYGVQVDMRGTEKADLVSARPGYSEHQSGLTGDVVACNGGCGTLDDLAGTPQGDWIVAHAWQYGWIVRYEKGHTGVTGYLPEPWHLRYIGTELATAYHDGGFHTLEEFFGLPAAPDYAH
ncbi:M15 family metallopeptidase [Microbacterium luticocti]|uniref:M15 family metallopeptidase n=1 Tax=Microbacterium luticocti TaxID=451764 RepID=UPI000418C53E|nr:M15 family metallopeptidase [Microbacterium luticocti]